jgi:hypothetical protein
MASTTDLPVIATFSNRGLAEAAVDDLRHSGFGKSEIGLAGPGELLHEATTASGPIEKSAENGAVYGAVTGGALGAVAGGLAVALIPGIGPVLAGGLLAGIAGGAAGGAAPANACRGAFREPSG